MSRAYEESLFRVAVQLHALDEASRALSERLSSMTRGGWRPSGSQGDLVERVANNAQMHDLQWATLSLDLIAQQLGARVLTVQKAQQLLHESLKPGPGGAITEGEADGTA
jgi:hypothetical protein